MFPLADIERIIRMMQETEDEPFSYEISSDYSVKLSFEFENGSIAITYIGRGYKIDSDVSYVPHDCLEIYLETMEIMMYYMERIREVIEATGEVDFDDSEYVLK